MGYTKRESALDEHIHTHNGYAQSPSSHCGFQRV